MRRNLTLLVVSSVLWVPWVLSGSWGRADEPIEPPHFHHVHLNVTNPAKTIEFYERVFGAVKVQYRGGPDALFTERSFILLNKVASPPPSKVETGIWHIGWGGVDIPNEYAWWKSHGVEFLIEPVMRGNALETHLVGPDREQIELRGMGHHRFAHVHLFATDVNATADWYAEHFGISMNRTPAAKPAPAPEARWGRFFAVDNVGFAVYGKPDWNPLPNFWREAPLTDLKPTDGHPIDHFAFSYRDIAPVFERLKKEGVEIVRPIEAEKNYGLKSFFIRGPDGVLVEIVEEKPIPEGTWEKSPQR